MCTAHENGKYLFDQHLDMLQVAIRWCPMQCCPLKWEEVKCNIIHLLSASMPGDSYHKWFRYLLLCPLFCDICQVLLIPFDCPLYANALGLILFQIIIIKVASLLSWLSISPGNNCWSKIAVLLTFTWIWPLCLTHKDVGSFLWKNIQVEPSLLCCCPNCQSDLAAAVKAPWPYIRTYRHLTSTSLPYINTDIRGGLFHLNIQVEPSLPFIVLIMNPSWQQFCKQHGNVSDLHLSSMLST